MSEQQPARRRSGGRLLAHVVVVIGVLAVTAGVFTLSYNAVRDIALAAGVTASLARLYPAILDAVFVVACAAALTLRDARWWTRGYAWLSVLVTGALIGAADVYHAMGLRLPHKIAAGTVAALPVALVLLGFSLWLSMLRHTRWSRTAAAPGPRAPAELGAGPALAIETGQPAPAEAVSAAERPALPALFASLWPATENTRPETEGVPPGTESAPPGTESAPPAQGALPRGRFLARDGKRPARRRCPVRRAKRPARGRLPGQHGKRPVRRGEHPTRGRFPGQSGKRPGRRERSGRGRLPGQHGRRSARGAGPGPRARVRASGRDHTGTGRRASGCAAARARRAPSRTSRRSAYPAVRLPVRSVPGPCCRRRGSRAADASAHVSVRPGPRDR